MAEGEQQVAATFTQLGNDLYWRVHVGEDGSIRWIGYDDSFWWDKVSVTDQFRQRVGPATGRLFHLNPETGEVTISAAPVSA